MARETHGDRGEGACAKVGDAVLFWKDDGHRARPVSFGESVGAVGNVFCDVGKLCNIRDVDNQRVERRAFFGSENFRERFGFECVAGEPINCFCRDGDDFSIFEETGGFAYTCPGRKFHFVLPTGANVEKRRFPVGAGNDELGWLRWILSARCASKMTILFMLRWLRPERLLPSSRPYDRRRKPDRKPC